MPTNELNLLHIVLDSGPVVKGVLISLILASIASWAIIFLKRRSLKEMRKNNEDFFKIYKSSSNLAAIYKETDMMPKSPFSTIFVNGYEEFDKFKSCVKGDLKSGVLQNHFKTFGLLGIERALKKGVNQSNLQLEKLLSTLASIGSISPFVGLFGTVWGIIDSFKGLAGGGGTIDAVAPGIAEALVATAIGLLAAIPAVWFFNHFSNQNSVINIEMENFEQDFLNLIERSLIS